MDSHNDLKHYLEHEAVNKHQGSKDKQPSLSYDQDAFRSRPLETVLIKCVKRSESVSV